MAGWVAGPVVGSSAPNVVTDDLAFRSRDLLYRRHGTLAVGAADSGQLTLTGGETLGVKLKAGQALILLCRSNPKPGRVIVARTAAESHGLAFRPDVFAQMIAWFGEGRARATV